MGAVTTYRARVQSNFLMADENTLDAPVRFDLLLFWPYHENIFQLQVV